MSFDKPLFIALCNLIWQSMQNKIVGGTLRTVKEMQQLLSICLLQRNIYSFQFIQYLITSCCK